nr:unnamed protein product [Digitaria exilis]
MATVARRSVAPARHLAQFTRHLSASPAAAAAPTRSFSSYPAHRHLSAPGSAASTRSFSSYSRDDLTRLFNILVTLAYQIVDPYLASYGAANPIFAVVQLAQTTMRSELGKMTLDKTFEERDALNDNIVKSINEAATDWGLKCLRYEIRDISPPQGVKAAMEMQVEAERKKRAQILESEGKKRAQILESEGEAGAVLALAEASARGIRMVSEAMTTKGSAEAANLRVAEQYVRAFSQVAKQGTTVLLPGDGGSPSSFVAQAFKIYQKLQTNSSQIVDPYLASYGAENPIFAVIQLAQTTMRSELGKMTLDKTFEERDALNENIVRAINEAATDWGLKCLRYEIRDISPPHGVKVAMEMQVEAERKKRAQILEAEGKKRAQILESEGEAGAVLALSEASARGIRMVSEAMTTKGSTKAANLRVAEQYVRAFSQVAKKGTTILLPSDGGNPSAFVAQAVKIFQQLQANSPQIEELEESAETDHAETSEMPPLIPDTDHGTNFSLQRRKDNI